MEHRYSERVDLNLKADIYKHGLLVGKGIIRNGSKYGLYLETEYDDTNPLQKLTLDIVQPYSSQHVSSQHFPSQQRVHHKLNTIVIYKDANGLGIELAGIGEEEAIIMWNLMSSTPAPTKDPVELVQAIAIA